MIENLFARHFSGEPLVARAPGRINLIGEHTDYNDGFVLPAAIDKWISVAVSKREDDLICLYSVQFDEKVEIRIADIKPVKHHWQDYVLGVVDQIKKQHHRIGGFNMLIDGDVPLGAGMSSSAAMECAVAQALNELFNLNLSKLAMVLIARSAEHEFAGVKCGIMDPFASVFGKRDHAIKLDCRSHEYEYIPLDLKGYKIVLFNSNVKHALAATEYNTRRQECEEGVRQLQKYFVGINSLRDVTLPMLEHITDMHVRKRCGYVISENARLLSGCEGLRKGDIASFGKKMFLSHDGLSNDYQVSCPELDWLVAAVRNNPAVAGARMMGGGFGGCTINIVREDAIEKLSAGLKEWYGLAMQKELSVYVADTADGAHIVPQKTTAS